MQMKKINPEDKFPCFNCFDHPKEKLKCEECKGNGWVLGSHPMVQFAQDFIEQRLSSFVGADNTHQQSTYIQNRMTSSQDPQKRPKQIFPFSSTKTMPLDEIRRSKTSEDRNELEHNFYCDQCITQQPIRGKRYHCQECEDFDLCEACYLTGVHRDHKFQEVLPLRKPDNQTLMSLNRKNIQLIQSIKKY